MGSEQPKQGAYPQENDGPRVLGVVLGITVFAVITMAARLWVRMKMIRNVGWDDYCMSFATLLVIIGAGIVVPEVHYGCGRHIDQISPEDFKIGFKLNFISQPIYLIAICIVKLSVGFFLLRIATIPFYRHTIQGIMAFMAFYTTGCFFTIMFQCTNLAVQWDQSVKGTCWSKQTIQALGYTNTACNIITDLLFAIVIPIPMLWQVQLNRRQKSSIVCILGLGIFATAAALVKISFLPNYGSTGDWLWDSRNITIWTILETCVGIIAGNLPCLKPLFRTVLGSTYGRGSRGRTGGTGNTPRYLGYGGGTNAASAKAKGFSSLNSSKADRQPHDPYEMKTMGGDERGSGAISPVSVRGDGGSDKSSEGSVELLDTQNAVLRLGGIMKTTEVTQSREATGGVPPSSRAGELELRPERGIRDMV
ncbi:uncharacterized protein CC84DRAFT_630037 [Paraphaeosphaeria sporulosa]|uniref:Rhodopsin domain-containing protein n=1 Tax=Paraphaeosphaeria sporulosa TaxID=1460663 RepID=A0A177CI00_9PLEO|nr:uncharacterized protein CC84DRAFT_630037 [Paraphaeosphaeria sporulosa]OAG06881.1 hypothetical protein CC84DRAFT_630037 [Paraphaeosphaeria sporulosa]